MKRLLWLFTLSAVTGWAQDTARMDEVAKAQVANDTFMGSVLVGKDGGIVFERSYGFANLEWKIPNTPQTKFRVGSLTKQFTAAAILLLEEKGKLKIEDLVAKYISNVPSAWKDLTLFHLLTHTSGIPSFSALPEYRTLKLSPQTPASVLEHLRERPLEFTPGEKYAYSNSGYVLLGWIVERVSGQSYETFLRENIFRPLGMNDSGYDSNTALIPRRAAGYISGASGPTNAPYIDVSAPHGASGLYSTTSDLLRWSHGLFEGKLLSPASLQKMTTPHLSGYALGLMVGTAKDRKVIFHGGAAEGFNAQIDYYPEQKVTVVVLANITGSTFQLARQLASVQFGER